MPSATVPMWTLASSPSRRSAISRALPVSKTSSELRLVWKVLPSSCCWPRPRPILNSRAPSSPAEHDEAALGAADVDGRVEHERQHVVEHAGAERPQAFEQAGDGQVADRARGGPETIDRLSGADAPGRMRRADLEYELGAAGASEPITSPGLRSRSVVTASPLTKVPKRLLVAQQVARTSITISA